MRRTMCHRGSVTESENTLMDVRIVELQPLRVASILGYGVEPELLAWNKLFEWASARHLFDQPHRLFGFNNPSPSVGTPQYGYEVWITVDESVQPDGTAEIKQFGGGKYAVTRVVGVDNIAPTWQEFVKWREASGFQNAAHQWLEEHIRVGAEVAPAEMVLDLYMPIR